MTIILLILIVFQCNPLANSDKNSHEIILQTLGTSSNTGLSESKEIISKRLRALQIKHFEIDQNNERSQLIIHLGDSLSLRDISNVILARGQVYFCPVPDKQDIIKTMSKLDSTTRLESGINFSDILKLLEIQTNFAGHGSNIGQAEIKDTAIIMKSLNSKAVKDLLPLDVKFLWGAKANDQKKFGLFVVSLTNSISGKTIKDAGKTGTTPKETGVVMAFNKEGADLWKDLTGRNLGKSVAIVIDNKVYAAPIVRSCVNNGECIITGNFTANEINNLIAVLKNGELPLRFESMTN